MPEDDSNKPKRNKPCESCRTHRRKCIMQHPNICARCQRMGIPCFFKFCTKPPSAIQQKKSISASKKNRLLKKFWLLEQDAELLESELKELTTNAKPSQQQQEEKASWQVCIQRSQQNLVMDTNITSITELLTIMQQVAGHFNLQHTPSAPVSNHGNQHSLPITLRVTPFEKALREMFTTIKSQAHHPAPPNIPTTELREIKQHLIDIYFACPYLHNPILVEPYYHGYMHQHLDDMISWAAAAYLAYSSCHHVKDYFLRRGKSDWTRTEVAEACEWEAKRQFDQAVFVDWTSEQHPTVSWIFTAHLLTHCALSTLRNRQARTYADVAWQMAIQSKDTYVPILKSKVVQQEDALVFAESWRRLYVVTRYMDISLNLVNDHCINVSQLAAHFVDIGFPQALDCERDNKELLEAVEAFHYLTKLHHVAFMGYGERLSLLAFRLYTGKLTTIGAEDLRAIEYRFVDFWHDLPPEHRIGTAPLDYIQMDRVHQCPSARALRVNAVYYVVIMSTMLRIMQQDGNGDDFPLMDRMDGERALLVVSICCDAVIKIYHVLHLRLPCTIELHWLSIVVDTVLMLVHAKNKEIRQRAQQGARTAKELFRQCSGHSTHLDETTPRSPDSTPTWTSSVSSSHSTSHDDSSSQELPGSPSPKYLVPRPPFSLTYHEILTQQMDAHLSAHGSHFYL